MAALTRDQFVTELQSRGWSRFAATDLQRYCDWGLRDILREAKWKDTIEVAIKTAISTSTIAFSAVDAAGVRQVKKVYRKTVGEEGWLHPLPDDEFFNTWLYVDATNSNWKGLPSRYYVYEDKIYLIFAPDKAHDFDVHYIKRMTNFAGAGNPSGLPEQFDEAILCAIEVYCFRRAREWEAMAVAQSEMRRIVLAELVEDGQIMEEQMRRVEPHR